MFTHKKTVIAITKQSIQVSIVALGNPPRKVETKTYPLSDKSLSDIITALAPTIKHSPVLVLISDDLSYTLKLTIPSSRGSSERAYIAEQIKSEIPEILENDEWDYKELKKTKNGTEVLIFAPVQKFFIELSQAVTRAGIKIDAIEPTVIAHARHEDPILGIALKQDIKGKDEDVLNVTPKKIPSGKQPTSQENQPSATESASSLPRPRPALRKKRIVVFFFIALVVSGTSYAAYKFFTPSPTIVEQTADSSPSPPEEPSPTEQEASPTPVDMSAFSVQVLNGTGEAGTSGAVRDLLEPIGFGSIDIGNADAFTFTDTEIRVKDGVPNEVVSAIADTLTDYSVISSDPLTNDFDYDVLIVVGEKG